MFSIRPTNAQSGVDPQHLELLTSVYDNYLHVDSINIAGDSQTDTIITNVSDGSQIVQTTAHVVSGIQIQQNPANYVYQISSTTTETVATTGAPFSSELTLEIANTDNDAYTRVTQASTSTDWIDLNANPDAIPGFIPPSPQETLSASIPPITPETIEAIRVVDQPEISHPLMKIQAFEVDYNVSALYTMGYFDANNSILQALGAEPTLIETITKNMTLQIIITFTSADNANISPPLMPLAVSQSMLIDAPLPANYLDGVSGHLTGNTLLQMVFHGYNGPIPQISPTVSIPSTANNGSNLVALNGTNLMAPTLDYANFEWHFYESSQYMSRYLPQVGYNGGQTSFDSTSLNLDGTYVVWMAPYQDLGYGSAYYAGSNPVIVHFGDGATAGGTNVSSAEVTLTVDNRNRVIRPDNLSYSDLCWEVYDNGERILRRNANNELILDLPVIMLDFKPATYDIFLSSCATADSVAISNTVTVSYSLTGTNLPSTNEVALAVTDDKIITQQNAAPTTYNTLTWHVFLNDQLVAVESTSGETSVDLRDLLGNELQPLQPYRVWLGATVTEGTAQPISNEVVVRFSQQEYDYARAENGLACLNYQQQRTFGIYDNQQSVRAKNVVILVHGVNTSPAAYDPWIEQVFYGDAWNDDLAETCIIKFHGGRYPLIQVSSIVGERSDPYIPNPGSLFYDGAFTGQGPAVWTGVEKLKQTVARVRRVMGNDIPITIVSHSQGTIVTLTALTEGMQVDNWILMGSPLHRWVVANRQDNTDMVAGAANVRGSVVNFWSRNDSVVNIGVMDGIGGVHVYTENGQIVQPPDEGIVGISGGWPANLYDQEAVRDDGFSPAHEDWWGNPSWLLNHESPVVSEYIKRMLKGYVGDNPPDTTYLFDPQQITTVADYAWDYGEAHPCDVSPSQNCDRTSDDLESELLGDANGWFGDFDNDVYSTTILLTPGMSVGPFFDDKTHANYEIACSEGQVSARLQAATWFDFEGAGTLWQTTAGTAPIRDSHNTSLSPEILYADRLDATYWLQIQNVGTTMAVCNVYFETHQDYVFILDFVDTATDVTLNTAEFTYDTLDCISPNPIDFFGNWFDKPERIFGFDRDDC